jgi:putative salt-induced outer membrane protein YdiY
MHRLVIAPLALAAAGSALSQAPVKEDGQWRAVLGAGLAAASGNTDSASVNVNGDAVRATPLDKWVVYGNALYAESDGATTAEQARLGAKYDFSLAPRWYAFGLGELEHDRLAQLALRASIDAGIGWRAVDTPELRFEVFGGAGYTSERYEPPKVVAGQLRDDDAYPTLLIGQESSHRWTATTTARQRLAVYPNLDDGGEYRAQWDAGLSVAINDTLKLTVGLSVKTNSDPGLGLEKTDAVFTTGVAATFN